MNAIKTIHDIMKQYTPNTTGVKRQASILIPLIRRNGELHILYEMRALHLTSQPGEICFPGGKIESAEKSCTTAIRETCEELNLDESEVRLIGQIDSLLTSFDMIIHCYVGELTRPFEDIQFSKDEVHEIFTIPLSALKGLNPSTYGIQSKMMLPSDFPFDHIPNGKDYNFKNSTYPVIFYHYEDRIIWGLTARMTQNFIKIISE